MTDTTTDHGLCTCHACKRKKIAQLNDLARTAMGVAGKLVQTIGISAMNAHDQSAIRQQVETYNDFSNDNDPWKERDFGQFRYNGTMIFWKIDYYDKSLNFLSEDPSDPALTSRVLTIMLASEY